MYFTNNYMMGYLASRYVDPWHPRQYYLQSSTFPHALQSIYMIRISALLLLLTLLSYSHSTAVNSAVSLAVTIYNDQFAMVKDVRSITFDAGRSQLSFTDVSSNIQPETVTFKAVSSPDSVKVYQQNFDANLINSYGILQKYIDKEIIVYAKLGDNSYKMNGTLLGYNSGYILKTKKGIQVLNNVQAISFPSLPAGFFTLPTLSWQVFSKTALTTNCEVAYRTTGFSWKSDYSITLNSNESKGDIGGWVTIDNRSGKRYSNAKLKLIAGDVNTVSGSSISNRGMVLQSAVAMAAPSFSEKSFSDFHLYTLSEPVSINDNSQKQVEFIPKVYNVPIRKYNLITISSGRYSQTNLKASNRLQFQNIKANGLGIALPKGIFRVFKTDDSDGSLEFIGQDSIDHTPKDQKLTLKTGNAFDITANKLITNLKTYNNSGYSADVNLTIYNHKTTPAEIVVEITISGGDNVKISWKNQGLKMEKVSVTLLRVTRIFKADEKYSLQWSEDYRP